MVAVIHCRGHQNVDAEAIKGNDKVEASAKRAALEPEAQQLLTPPRPDAAYCSPVYTKGG